jgi:aspartyl-tRNA(Asn)/glutamyl-tRNA(Gln) amidotransferase subunit A
VSEPYEMSAHELTKAYRERNLTPRDVLESVLARMGIVEPTLNAFCARDDAAARLASDKSSARWASGAQLGDLDGVPISIKDLVDVAGFPTRHGSEATGDSHSNNDAPCVVNLREEGAIIPGKTTTPEFGHKGVTDSPLTGVTRNPWNTDMTTGGSSGGAAAALASGMGPLAVGTDGGGSCRKPANYCGLVGMKPSLGRVPLAATGGFWPLSSPGPMTRSVRDAANLLAVMARPQVSDPFVLPLIDLCVGDEATSLKGLRIAHCIELAGANARSEVSDAISQQFKVFTELGADVEEAQPDIEDPLPFYRTLLDSGSALNASAWSDGQLPLADTTFREGVERGRALSAVELRAAYLQRGAFASSVAKFFERYDLLVLPCNPTTAYDLGSREPPRDPDDTWKITVCFTAPFNITGQPSITIPFGHTASGLPLGLQIVGRYGRDDLVLRAAAAFEATTGLANQMVSQVKSPMNP